MQRFRVFLMTMALAATGQSQASAAEPPLERTTLIQKLFGPSKPKPAGPTVRNSQHPFTISAPLPPDQLAEALRAEQDAYLRRMSVCYELRRIAIERHDDAMVRQADELERQSGALYNARVAALGVSRTKAPLPEPTVARRNTADDYPLLANTTMARYAARQLEAPASPVPGTTTAQMREVKP